jgi:hypothetical protein
MLSLPTADRRPIARTPARLDTGHKQFSTTESYIQMVEELGVDNFGGVFPPLPAELGEDSESARGNLATTEGNCHMNCHKTSQVSEIIVEAPGIEPGSGSPLPVHLRA